MESLPQIDEGVLENLKMPKGPQLTFMKAKKQLLEQKAPRKCSRFLSAPMRH